MPTRRRSKNKHDGELRQQLAQTGKALKRANSTILRMKLRQRERVIMRRRDRQASALVGLFADVADAVLTGKI